MTAEVYSDPAKSQGKDKLNEERELEALVMTEMKLEDITEFKLIKEN